MHDVEGSVGKLRQEPSRLASRYVTATFDFTAAVIEDQMRGGLRNVGSDR